MFEAAFFCGRWFLCFFAFFTALFSRNSGKGHKSEPRNLVSALALLLLCARCPLCLESPGPRQLSSPTAFKQTVDT